MNRKKGIGLILIITGIFIIVAQPLSLTGAVIDISTVVSKISFIVGFALIISGIFLFITKTSALEESVAQKLWRETREFLEKHGVDYKGRTTTSKSPEQYKQDNFEKAIETGAYSSQKEKHH